MISNGLGSYSEKEENDTMKLQKEGNTVAENSHTDD